MSTKSTKCQASGKESYSSYELAAKVLRRVNPIDDPDDGDAGHVYGCKACGGWHFSRDSQAEYSSSHAPNGRKATRALTAPTEPERKPIPAVLLDSLRGAIA